MSAGADASGKADDRRPLPAGAAVLELARAALTRTIRGRALWVVAAIAALPTLVAMILTRAGDGIDERTWERTFVLCQLMLVVVPPVLVASAIADELEDKTAAYLWSRALPRWTIIVGKLVALAPICAVLVGGSGLVAYLAADMGRVVSTGAMLHGVVGLAAAGAAAAALAAAIAMLVPRHAVAVAVGWMLLVDSSLGALDLRLHHLSTTFGARAIAGFDRGGMVTGAITLAVLTMVGVGVACWRVEKVE